MLIDEPGVKLVFGVALGAFFLLVGCVFVARAADKRGRAGWLKRMFFGGKKR